MPPSFKPKLGLTSGLTLNKVKLDADNVTINNSKGEDAVNIISSTFNIFGLEIYNSFSDAIDLHFSEGKMGGIKIYNSGNDSLELSLSNVEVDGLFIRGAGDKSLSLGERSKLRAQNLQIHHTDIAFASKDGSLFEINNILISDAPVGIEMFNKKPELGQTYGKLDNVSVGCVATLRLIERGLSINMNGLVHVGEVEKVSNLMYGALYGKATK